ncbi:hypothetical protein VKT23_001358 [Stygiomarasmius scandens]|uniref:F-box domain-containing protein n=1 Tax=Marasmiellus scandens TaxID=2682957 RepID=A0ABR1K9A9_9AGAR
MSTTDTGIRQSARKKTSSIYRTIQKENDSGAIADTGSSTSADTRKLSKSSLKPRQYPRKRGTIQPQRSFLLNLPDELLVLIAQETTRHGMVKIKTPEYCRRLVSGMDKKQPSIYHLSMVSRRIRGICWEFLFRNVEFLLYRDAKGDVFEVGYLGLKLRSHDADVLGSIRRISFKLLAAYYSFDAMAFQPFALEIISLCPNLRRISLPTFYSLDESRNHEALLQAACEHSPNLLLVYNTGSGWYYNQVGLVSGSLSRVILSSLDISRYTGATTWAQHLLERGLRVENLDNSNPLYTDWYAWSCITYTGLRTVTGWRPSSPTPIQDFLRAHPLLQKLEICVEREDMKELSVSWFATVPGAAKLFQKFPFHCSSHNSTLRSLTLVRRAGDWKVEEVDIVYDCPWQYEDFLAMAKNLRSVLPAQISRVTTARPTRILAKDRVYVKSLLTKQGLSVMWK